MHGELAGGPFRPILMPFQRLRRVLETTYRVNVCSSPAIVARVQKKIESRQARLQERGRPVPETKPPSIVPSLQSTDFFSIRAIDLLRKIGDLTTPAWVNMATLSASWATRRYFWAIDDSPTTGRRFRLSPDVTDLDFHQKTLLSDEFGIGMAGLVLEQLFDAGSSVDVSAALKDANLYQDVRQSGTAQPDFLMWNPAPTMPYFVVECKGCQTSLAAATDQIRRGLEQVPSLVFGAGDRPASTLVVATLMQKSGTTTYVIDPPNDDERDDGKKDREPPSERIGKRTWRINNPDEFARRAWDVRRAQILNWAGQFRSAVEILGEETPQNVRQMTSLDDQPLTTQVIGDLTFRGRSLALFPELGGAGLRLFSGVQEDLLGAARENRVSSEKIATELGRRRRDLAADEHVPPNTSISTNGTCFVVQGIE